MKLAELCFHSSRGCILHETPGSAVLLRRLGLTQTFTSRPTAGSEDNLAPNTSTAPASAPPCLAAPQNVSLPGKYRAVPKVRKRKPKGATILSPRTALQNGRLLTKNKAVNPTPNRLSGNRRRYRQTSRPLNLSINDHDANQYGNETQTHIYSESVT